MNDDSRVAIYENPDGYWIRQRDGKIRNLSNFIIEIISRHTHKNEMIRLIKFRVPDRGLCVIKQIRPKEMFKCPFKKFCERIHPCVNWRGKGKDAAYLWRHIYKQSEARI